MLGSEIVLIILLVLLSAYFSIIEASFLSVSIVKVSSFLKENKLGAKALMRLKQDPRRMLTGIIVANTVVNFTAVSVSTIFFLQFFPEYGIWISTLVMTVIVLIFGQLTPKIIAEQHADKLALIMAQPAEIMLKLLYPIAYIFEKITILLSRRFETKGKVFSDKELKEMVLAGKREGGLSSKAAEMMHNIIEFQETKLTDLMTPKSDVLMMHADDRIADAGDKMLKRDISRIPVYNSTSDHIIGIVSLTDVLRAVRTRRGRKKLRSVMQEPYVIPDTKNVQDLICDFESKDIHLGIVIDEYGLFAGIITVDDLLRRILGHFVENIRIPPRKTEVLAGKTSISEVNFMFRTNIREKGVVTVAGLMEKKLQKIPSPGEGLQVNSLNFKVLKSTKQSVQLVRISRVQ
jgi:putative hemolysin